MSKTLLNMKIADTPMPTRPRRWLTRAGIRTIGELIQRTEADIAAINNLADTSIMQIKQFLARHGLALAEDREHHCTADMVQQALRDSRCALSRREREILKLRHGLGVKEALTLNTIGHRHNITRERVRQIQQKAEEKVIASVMFK